MKEPKAEVWIVYTMVELERRDGGELVTVPRIIKFCIDSELSTERSRAGQRAMKLAAEKRRTSNTPCYAKLIHRIWSEGELLDILDTAQAGELLVQ